MRQDHPWGKPRKDAPTFVDLFCGCGGASLGFVQAGWRHLCGIDLSKMALTTYQYNLGNAVCGDVKHLPLREDLDIDLVWFSPPCQGFSSCNVKKKDAEGNLEPKVRAERYLLMYAAIAIEYLHPKFILMENVPPTMYSLEFKEMTFFLQHESTTIYNLSWQILNFADYGVPQSRHRLIMYGIRDSAAGIIEMDMEMSFAELNRLTLPERPLPKDPAQAQLFEYGLEAVA